MTRTREIQYITEGTYEVEVNGQWVGAYLMTGANGNLVAYLDNGMTLEFDTVVTVRPAHITGRPARSVAELPIIAVAHD